MKEGLQRIYLYLRKRRTRPFGIIPKGLVHSKPGFPGKKIEKATFASWFCLSHSYYIRLARNKKGYLKWNKGVGIYDNYRNH